MKMMNKPSIWLAWLSIIMCGLFGLYSISLRYQVEQRNKAVNLAVEFDVIESLAVSEGIKISDAISQLKASGVNAVVLSEETVGDLISEGSIVLSVDGDHSQLVIQNESLRERVKQSIGSSAELSGSALKTELPPSYLRSLSIGLNPAHADRITNSELRLIARLSNPLGAKSDTVQIAITSANKLGAEIFLPQGEQVLGQRDLIGTLIESLRTHKMLYASPEFTKISGDSKVLDKAPDLVVRLHSAQAAELDKLSLGDAIERYSKAARERNMRVLLVRPHNYSAESPFKEFASFLSKIRNESEKDGIRIANAHPFTDSGVPVWVFVFLSVGLVPGLFWLVAQLKLGSTIKLTVFVLAAILALGGIMDPGRNYAALIGAMMFPLIAYTMLLRSNWNLPIAFLTTSLISLVGGLCVAGYLNGLPYFIKADQFAGVKLAHFLPIFVIGYILISEKFDLKRVWESNLTLGVSIISILVLGLLAFMAARTGNDSPAGVSGLELKLRSLLDSLLPVRPRTKEFMIGHPALILGIGGLIFLRKTSNPTTIKVATTLTLLAIGAIGQTSIVNTLCHLHSPVDLSLLRIATGILSGGIIGGILWIFTSRYFRDAGGEVSGG